MVEDIEFSSFLDDTDNTDDKWLIPESKLDKTQKKIINDFDADMVVSGGAGSGKTLLAIYKLERILNENLGTFAFIVYTVTLKEFIKSGIKEISILNDKTKKLKIYHRRKAEELINSNQFEKVDYIIIDEVQDLDENFIRNICNFANKKVFLLGDDAQQLYGDDNNEITLEDIGKIVRINKSEIIKLEKNYRVPKEIAKFSGKIIKDNGALYSRCQKKYGYKPNIKQYDSLENEIKSIINIINEESLTNVGILVPRNEDVENILEKFESANFEVEYKYYKSFNPLNYEDTINYLSELPKLMTYHSSKGLEFDYVFLPMCEDDIRIKSKYFNQNSLYVACTRTKKRLYISYTRKICKYIQNNEDESEIYEIIPNI